MQTEHHFGEMNDHLVEMKEIIKAHDVISEKKAFDRHTEVMARLGMVLTEVGKVIPVQTVTTGYMQAFPLEETSPVKTVMKICGRPKKMKGK